MRLLSIKMGTDDQSRNVIVELRRTIPDVWIAGVEERPGVVGTPFDEVVTSHYDAYLGTYERVDLPSIPMTPELYALVAPFEGQCLNMLERVKFHTPSDYPPPVNGVPKYVDSYESRVDLFGRHCRFWNHIFDRFSIDAVISQNFGHQGFDFVALNLARAKGIPTLIFNETGQFPMVQFVQEDVEGLGKLDFGAELKRRLRSSLTPEAEDFIRRSLSSISSSPDRYEVKRVDEFKTTPFRSWLVDSNARVNPRISVNVLANAIVKKGRRFLNSPTKSARTVLRTRKWARATKASMAEERAHSRAADTSVPYVYFPLHFQPEATTSVKGRSFFRLREAVAHIAHELPDGWQLVVKEHPHQWRRLLPRPDGFFAQLSAIPRVQLVHHTADNNGLVESARAVACVSHSSITAHAVLRGIPVISLGYSHFRQAPGYCCVEDTEQLRAAIREIDKGTYRPNAAEFESFIQQLEGSTFEALLGYRPSSIDGQEYERIKAVTAKNLSLVIKEWLVLRGVLESIG